MNRGRKEEREDDGHGNIACAASPRIQALLFVHVGNSSQIKKGQIETLVDSLIKSRYLGAKSENVSSQDSVDDGTLIFTVSQISQTVQFGAITGKVCLHISCLFVRLST